MNPHTTAVIKARCRSYNQAHTLLNRYKDVVLDWVRSMEGAPIFKVTGGLLKKHETSKPWIAGIRIEVSAHTIRMEAINCACTETYKEKGEEVSVREDTAYSLYLANIDGMGCVKDVDRYAAEPPLKTDHNPGLVMVNADKIEELQAKMKKLQITGILSVRVDVQFG